MNYCPKCEAEPQEDTDVCSFCGIELIAPQQEARFDKQNYYAPMSGSKVNLAKVLSIILIVFGAIALFLCIEVILVLDEVIPEAKTLIVYKFLMSAGTLTVGIIGNAKCKNRESANIFIIMGAVLIGLKVIDLIWVVRILKIDVDLSIVASAILGCTLPILLIVAGSKMKQPLE